MPRPLTVADLWSFGRVGAPISIPGGGLVVPVTTYDLEANEGRTRLWLHLEGQEPRVLTTDAASSSEPAPSPDGDRLAFVRRRGKDKPQLHVMHLDGGEAQCVTDLPLGVVNARWLPDGKRLVVLAPVLADAPAPADTKERLAAREKEPAAPRVTEDRFYRYWDRWLTGGEAYRFFVLDLETGALRDLTPGSTRWFESLSIGETWDVSPEGTHVAFSANVTEPPFDVLRDAVFEVPVAGGPVQCLTADEPADAVRPRYSPDGRCLIWGAQKVPHHYADRFRVVRMDRKTGERAWLTESWDRSPSEWAISPDGRRVALAAEDRGRVHVFALDLAASGDPVRIAAGGTCAHPAWTAQDRIAFTRNDLRAPPEVWTTSADGKDGTDLRQVTHVNDVRLQDIEMGEVRELEVEGAQGRPVQAFVLLPPGFDPARKWPLVHLVHGGPHGVFGDQFHFRWNAQLFAAPGYVVLMTNFHGSTSFGQAFVDSIHGAHGDKPFADVMAATDRVVAEGYVDEARMAAAGGSYGGYLVSWIAGHTKRFACLVNHAGVFDTLAEYASDVTHGRDRSYGGEPWAGLDAIDRWNPARFADGFQTPMLVLHGEQDFRVPVNQAMECYGIYRAKGIPARLVIYPDENHWILKPKNAAHWWGEVHGWLRRWIG